MDCNEMLVGRSDKKFCNDACRSNYNNKIHAEKEMYIRKINAILKKNRIILRQLNPMGKTTVPKKRMDKLGFNFRHFTHLLETAKGNTYLFCYEYGYLIINESEVLLVKNETFLNNLLI